MLSKCHSLCCFPIAGLEQLNDKAADQPRAPQTGAGSEKALRGEGGAQDGPAPPLTPGTGEKSSSIYQHREAPAWGALGQGTGRRAEGEATRLQRAPRGRSKPGGTPPLGEGLSC